MKVYYVLEDGLAIQCETGEDKYDVESLQNAVKYLNQFDCSASDIQVYPLGTTPDNYHETEPLESNDYLPDDTTPADYIYVHSPEKLVPTRRQSEAVIPLPTKTHRQTRRGSMPIVTEYKRSDIPDYLKCKCFVKWGHQSIVVKMDPDEPLIHFRMAIEDATGIPAFEQRFNYCGADRPFDDDKCLRDYGCQGGGFFNLKRAPSPPPNGQPRRATFVAQANPFQLERRNSLITTAKEAEARRAAEEAAEQLRKELEAELEAERKREEEEEAARKAAAEAQRQQEEADRLAREAEELARKRAAEEEARRKAAEEEARRKAAEEEARRKAAEEEAARKTAEEEAARKKAAEEEAARKAAEEAARKAEEERRRQQEEADRLERERLAAEEAARKAEEERLAEMKRKADEAERQRKQAEEEARLAELARKQAEEEERLAELARKQAEEEARLAEEARRREAERLERERLAEEARKRAEEEEEARRKAAEEAERLEQERLAEEARLALEARRKAEEEKRLAEEARKKAEEEAKRAAEARKKMEEEEAARLAAAAKKKAEEEWAARLLEEQKKAAEEEKARKEAEEKARKEKEEADAIWARNQARAKVDDPSASGAYDGPGQIGMPKHHAPIEGVPLTEESEQSTWSRSGRSGRHTRRSMAREAKTDPVVDETLAGPCLLGLPPKKTVPPKQEDPKLDDPDDTLFGPMLLSLPPKKIVPPKEEPKPDGALDGPGLMGLPKKKRASRKKEEEKKNDDAPAGWPSRQIKYEFTPTPIDLSRQRVWYQLEGDFVPYYIKFNGWETTIHLKNHILATRRSGRNAKLLEGVEDLDELKLFPPGKDENGDEYLDPDDTLPTTTTETSPILVIVGESNGYGRDLTPLSGRRKATSSLWPDATSLDIESTQTSAASSYQL